MFAHKGAENPMAFQELVEFENGVSAYVTPVGHLDFFRYPSFHVYAGVVELYWACGGIQKFLLPGDSVSYRKHGAFFVECTYRDWGVIRHIDRFGNQYSLTIPPRAHLVVHNGVMSSQVIQDEEQYEKNLRFLTTSDWLHPKKFRRAMRRHPMWRIWIQTSFLMN